ncbi:Protein of unknown function DUF2458 [Penicillium bovifimosum]|uniref:Uncharacterized protein n=1 Tax=Penicillium bovifimosum TaxID=126998 RepID=A0A9W9GIF2_9EURO|nr:Protein of unknown function DUF2458 [Penicillium bovifimosum]KAJ5120434.1 Protein of unknown function DUF2458 [Penicillium bovifimosum]
MARSSYDASDLNSVLSRLSNLSQPQSSSQQHYSSRNHTPNTEASAASLSAVPPRPRPITGRSASATDSSTITTWPEALRYVMRTVGQNEEIQSRIRGMIRSQHHHEKQWFEGRHALLKQQQSRPQKQRELDAVLRSIGAPVKEDDGSAEKEYAAELAAYDAKVHGAATQMSDALTAELRGLNVPFFTLRKDMIQEERDRNDPSAPSNPPVPTVGYGGGNPPISKSELVKLQRRMLELLEDLCKE